jgi:hypothetical protein
MFKRRRKPRRGVVLLVVLSLLVLFLMIAVTFVLVAGQYKRGAIAISKVNQTDDKPEKLLDAALYQLLRGTNTRSSLFGHDLLGDLYGIDGVGGTVGNAAPDMNVGGQIMQISFNPNPSSPYSPIAGSYIGNVFTMLEGPAKGHSTRVVGYAPTVDNMGTVTGGALRIEAFETDSSQNTVPGDLIGRAFGINGRAFNGTGAGYDPNPLKMNLDSVDEFGNLVALLPHYINYTAGFSANRGGGDESYDAPDWNNMWMAMVPPSATSSSDIIPSFHRPELVNYWNRQVQNGSTLTPLATLLPRCVLRPLPITGQHPNFTGSNPAMSANMTAAAVAQALINGTAWDVDNDGDGITDSIWIDIGLPIKRSPQGKLYKPLVAIMCRDLDGRLNVNAHGNLAQLDPTYSNPVMGSFAGGNNTLGNLPRGLGEGPKDIFLGHIFTTAVERANILTSRYGPDGGTPRPGISGVDDALSAVKQLGVPDDYTTALSLYASPPDVWGRGALALDYNGQPITRYMGVGASQRVDDPYEIDLSRNGSQDTGAWDRPYTLAELERVLRWYDVDMSTQPGRLLQIAQNSLNGTSAIEARRRGLITTESRYIPVSNAVIPPEIRNQYGAASGQLLDLFAAKLIQNGVPLNNVSMEMTRLLPFELLHGQRFDVNRFLGNGRDDTPGGNPGSAVVDEPLESGTPEQAWTSTATPGSFQSVAFNHRNNDPVTTDSRLNFARQLYCLMMFLVDQNYVPPMPLEPGLSQAQMRELHTRRIAQWAINVVDFRDPDSIMTPFEYDAFPFQDDDGNPANGTWDVDGVLGTSDDNAPYRRLVWGCEYPEVLLTETKAFHDRAVKDTDQDPSGKKRMDGDPHLDQFRIPRGSLFIELYCTRNRLANNPQLPFELYNSATNRLDLARLAPSDGTRRHPVWRIAISEQTGAGGATSPRQRSQPGQRPESTSFDPTDMNLLSGAPDPLNIDRVVWFTGQDPTGFPLEDRTYVNNVGWDVSLEPNQYLVIGPRANNFFGSKDDLDPTMIWDGQAPQRIRLTTLNRGMANDSGVIVSDVDGAVTSPAAGTQIKSAVGMIADAAASNAQGWAAGDRIGLSISEPYPQAGNYYPKPMFANDAYDDLTAPTGTFLDQPLDSDPAQARPLLQYNMLSSRTYEDVRSLFLQRLADPTRPFNPVSNPYITVDWATTDLTVFSGEEDTTKKVDVTVGGVTMANRDIDEQDDPIASQQTPHFGTRQRGEISGGAPNGNIWSPFTNFPPVTAPSGAPENYFKYSLVNTLGYLNTTTLGPALGSPPSGYEGSPGQPFPWLTWNNRPYASPLELMLVPASSASRLGHEFSLHNGSNPYPDSSSVQAPYGHLLNFFQTAPVAMPPTPPTPAAHFYRLFDYVETPSKFVGTEKWYNPTQFAAAASPSAADTYRPPYNRWSRFRDPGRVNINTIFDPMIWEGITKGFPSWDPNQDSRAFWTQLALSRQGYGTMASDILTFDNNYPTRFANPFRSAASADLMPLTNMRKSGVEATLLRPNPNNTTQPLFEYTSNNAYNNTDRNPYFRYQGLTRLENLVSTNSNVFAVWITVGYFEVERYSQGPTLPSFPDGYQLAQELGLDSGEVKRHRAFYIIDRSIPVAYQPGENHNVDRTILLRRFIE